MQHRQHRLEDQRQMLEERSPVVMRRWRRELFVHGEAVIDMF